MRFTVIVASLAVVGCRGHFDELSDARGGDPAGDADRGDAGDAPDAGASPRAITAGTDFACAVRDGAVWCWGDDHSGQLGDNATTPQPRPVRVVGITDATSVVAGESHACALRAGGSVSCWGTNASKQLGVTSAGTTWMPNRLAAGGEHTCAVDSTSRLRCWGNNNSGEIGDGTTTDRSNPITNAALGPTVVDVAAAEASTCAQTTSGAYCWGANYFGQLGDGTAADRSTPAMVKSLATAARPAAGATHSCALVGGEVSCWGDNAVGQLGIGTFSLALSAVDVAFP